MEYVTFKSTINGIEIHAVNLQDKSGHLCNNKPLDPLKFKVMSCVACGCCQDHLSRNLKSL